MHGRRRRWRARPWARRRQREYFGPLWRADFSGRPRLHPRAQALQSLARAQDIGLHLRTQQIELAPRQLIPRVTDGLPHRSSSSLPAGAIPTRPEASGGSSIEWSAQVELAAISAGGGYGRNFTP